MALVTHLKSQWPDLALTQVFTLMRLFISVGFLLIYAKGRASRFRPLDSSPSLGPKWKITWAFSSSPAQAIILQMCHWPGPLTRGGRVRPGLKCTGRTVRG